jgi:hypothetical protein
MHSEQRTKGHTSRPKAAPNFLVERGLWQSLQVHRSRSAGLIGMAIGPQLNKQQREALQLVAEELIIEGGVVSSSQNGKMPSERTASSRVGTMPTNMTQVGDPSAATAEDGLKSAVVIAFGGAVSVHTGAVSSHNGAGNTFGGAATAHSGAVSVHNGTGRALSSASGMAVKDNDGAALVGAVRAVLKPRATS